MINLSRTVEVRCIDVAATVAVEQERPEFLAIVQLAKHRGGELTPQQVQQELLKPLPEQACRLALDRCVKLKMLEWTDKARRAARLSELGELAVETSMVLVPMEGGWRFHLVDDPLVPQRVVHMEKIQTKSAYNDMQEARNAGEGFQAHFPVPSLLQEMVDTTPHRSLADFKLRQIQEVADKGRELNKGSLKLDLSWPEDGPPMVRLTGRLPESEHRIDAVTGSSLEGWRYIDLWTELASVATGIPVDVMLGIQRRFGRLAIPVSFETVGLDGRKAFRMDFPVPKTGFRGIGEFQPSSLSQADILPATEQDAQDWCEWLQWNDITDYVTPEMLRTQAAGVLARFPHHRPGPLEPEDMRALALRNNNRSAVRHVLAPADLGLWS